MEVFAGVLLGIGIGVAIAKLMLDSKSSAGGSERAKTAPTPNRPPDETRRRESEVDKLATQIGQLEGIRHPQDLLGASQFQHALEQAAELPTEILTEWAISTRTPHACLALQTLAHREPNLYVAEKVLDALSEAHPYNAFFMMRLLSHWQLPDPVAGWILVKTAEWCYSIHVDYRHELLRHRLDRMPEGAEPSFGAALEALDVEDLEHLETSLNALGPNAEPMRREFAEWKKRRVNRRHLAGIGRLAPGTDPARPAVTHNSFERHLAQLARHFEGDAPRSLVLVGKDGVGKSRLVAELASRLRERGWQYFEAGSNDLLAGQSHMGELEERVQKVLEEVKPPKQVLWSIPDFPALQFAGKHKYSPVSVMDMVLPALDRGELTIIGEATPASYEKLLIKAPRLRGLIEDYRVDPLDADATREVIERWGELHKPSGHSSAVDPSAVDEVIQLADQYVTNLAAPGNVLELLDFSRLAAEDATRAAGSAEAPAPLTTGDLIDTLAKVTGLPVDILDQRERLNLTELESQFGTRIIGQEEAVGALIERVAMIKAGTIDPTRPAGVFLFAGPTGTGKTEIAKTLAEMLFGSPNRLVRIDMSEMQGPESLDRIMGSNDPDDSTRALVNHIREQPFSVVLLDEFEKAHPKIWDVFLQVFDDGRLTDRRGRNADFRHAIVILTSNLGSQIPTGTSLGFGGESGRFSHHAVQKEIDKTFRREFVNRLDRIIIFRPLSRETMRKILRKELELAFNRRGLRQRSWAVEWDDAALEFLLDEGFTQDLGARPLKRSIERHLLAPLSRTIVDHQVPEGEQFLFIRLDGDRLDVQFVDPDAPEGFDEISVGSSPDDPPLGAATEPAEIAAPTGPRIEPILLRRGDSSADYEVVLREFERVLQALESEAWRDRKTKLLETMGDETFWGSDDRHTTLELAERMDRVESAAKRQQSLIERLSRLAAAGRARVPEQPFAPFARMVRLLGLAMDAIEPDHPWEVFVRVRPAGDAVGSSRIQFLNSIAEMYVGWARVNRMRLATWTDGTPKSQSTYLAVSGFASGPILMRERGLHVSIPPADDRDAAREHVRVDVVPQPPLPRRPTESQFRKAANESFDGLETGELSVVRRYQFGPSPLVRDAVGEWRTGLIDRVLGGDFDLFG